MLRHGKVKWHLAGILREFATKGEKAMKRTSSKTAVSLFDLAMLATIGGASAGAFYGILRLAIWLAVQ